MKPQPIKVALVEDREDIRNSLVALMDTEECLFCVGSFADGESAVEEIPKLEVEIVLMDIGLPGMDGIECVKKLKALNPALQFMICTIYDEDEKVFEALDAGAHSYILKGSNFNRLVEAIRELHRGGSPMSSDIARKVVSAFHRKQEAASLYKLTPREIEILNHLAKGLSYSQISDDLCISEKTFKKHVYNIYGKLHVHSRTEALNKYFGKY